MHTTERLPNERWRNYTCVVYLLAREEANQRGNPSHSGEPANVSPLLDVPAAAARLNISERHLRELIYRREVPYLKVGRLVRFDPNDLEAWLAARRVPAGPGRGRGAA